MGDAVLKAVKYSYCDWKAEYSTTGDIKVLNLASHCLSSIVLQLFLRTDW